MKLEFILTNWKNKIRSRKTTNEKIKMKKLKFSKKEYNIAGYLVVNICKSLKKKHPKLIKVDSNLFHFIIYDVAKKCKLSISRGWFKHGGYCPVVDDVLIDFKMMDKSQHQMYGNEQIMEKIIECDCHK